MPNLTDLAKAEGLCRQLVQEASNLPVAWHLLSLLLQDAGRAEDAVEPLRRAAALAPADGRVQKALGLLLLSLEQPAEAEASLRAAVGAAPHDPELLLVLAEALERQEKWREAADVYRVVITRAPGVRGAFHGLARTLIEDGTPVELMLATAERRLRQRRLDEAVTAVQAILAGQPNHLAALGLFGMIQRERGNRGQALQLLTQVCDQAPDNARFHLELGKTLYPFDYEGNSALSPPLDVAREEFPQHNIEMAIRAFRRAIELDPALAEAHAGLGNALRTQQFFNEALPCLIKAIELAPTVLSSYANLGRVCYRLGRLEEAAAAFGRVLECTPENEGLKTSLETVRQDLARLHEAADLAQRRAIRFESETTAEERAALRATEAPIIFIHFGFSNYLIYSLLAARLFNPEKRVILLGDAANARLTALGIEHFHFDDYADTPEIRQFESSYRFTSSARTVWTGRWTNFIFKRWFLMYNFAVANGIQRFWTFDSDTLILMPLKSQEGKFQDYDCTEQCGGCCINGYIGNQGVVRNFLDKINEIFQRTDFLDQYQKDHQYNGAFNELEAYQIYKRECNFRSINLGTVIDNEMYERHASGPLGEEDEFLESEDGKKRFFFNNEGYLCRRSTVNDAPIRLVTINMSWMPIEQYRTVILGSLVRLPL